MRVSLYFSIATFCAAAACGQTVVEHSVGTAAGSGAAAGASGAGKSIGGVFRGLSETVDKTGTGKQTANTRATPAPATPTATTAAATTATTPSPSSKRSTEAIHASRPIDPSQVTEGLDGAELIQRFGPPVWRVSEKINSQLVERLWYHTTSSSVGTSDEVEIKLIDGKVASVIPPAGAKKAEPHN